MANQQQESAGSEIREKSTNIIDLSRQFQTKSIDGSNSRSSMFCSSKMGSKVCVYRGNFRRGTQKRDVLIFAAVAHPFAVIAMISNIIQWIVVPFFK